MKTLLASALLIAVYPSAVVAQTTIGTPTPGTGNCLPFGCNSTNSATGQDNDYFQIYSSSAFNGPITFNTLSFADSGLNFSSFVPGKMVSPDLLAGNYTITFSTSVAPLGTGYPVAPLLNTQTFFSGSLSPSGNFSGFSIAGGEISYDPSQGNLVLEVVASNQAPTPNSGANGYLQEDRSGFVLSRAFNETGYGVYQNSDGLVTTFSEGPLSAVPEPATWAMMLVGLAMVGARVRLRRKAASAILARREVRSHLAA